MNLNKLNKKQSGLVFLFIYLFTMIIGFGVYLFSVSLFFHPILSMLIADIVMTIIIFVIGSIINNASLYDPYWSVIPLFIVLLWVPVYSTFNSLPVIMVISVIAFWSIRLTYNWWKNWEGFKYQDWRYDLLRDKNPKLYPITNFFGIHLIPTIVVFLQMIVIYQVIVKATLNLGFIIGIVISLTAPMIQYIADKQMFDFRLNNIEKKSVIDVGLWKYSRHPNYFGELIFWIGFYVMYLSSNLVINLYILFPIAMILLFVFISVPMMENKLKNRPGFEEYKNSVSMIIPFIRKKSD